MIEIDWNELSQLSGDALRVQAFHALQSVAVGIQDEPEDDPRVLGAVPRLTELVTTKDELHSFRPILATLARSVGLWNYIDTADADDRDRLLAETATVNVGRQLTLHREQVEALNVLLSGRSLILSAPTSFGKSLLIDVLLSTGRYQRVAIILPTIALLDEFRKRLTVRFGNRFDVIMHHSQAASDSSNVIYLGTQERLVNRDDIGSLDLLVVDEFYKLDPSRQDDRSMTLNAAVYKLIRRSGQFFFLGPNIEGLRFEPDGRWKFEFLRTKFSTVAVDTFDLRKAPRKLDSLREEAFRQSNWPALVFVSGPDAANTLANKLLDSAPTGSPEAKQLAAWISDNYGSNWSAINAVAAGIGLHHGRMPRSLAAMFVRMFNDDTRPLPVLLCTSTLIEGVNTAAKSVLIYDKVINKSDYDFFTFSNIRGRAGRLGQHLVGRVFLFHTPPETTAVEIDSPVFENLDEAPDELVVHLEEEEQTAISRSRVTELSNDLGLSAPDLRRLSSLGMDTLGRLKVAVEEQARRSRSALIWSRYAQYENLLALSQIICSVRQPSEFGAASAAQLERFIRKLRAPGTFRAFFIDYASSIKGYEARFENIFKFLRACEYNLPEFFTAIEKFAKLALPAYASQIDYTLLIGEISHWFRPEPLKALEEQGVPIQISERYLRNGDTVRTLAARLRELATSSTSPMSALERNWVLGSLPLPGDR